MNIQILQPLVGVSVMRHKRSSILHSPLVDNLDHHWHRLFGCDRTLKAGCDDSEECQHFLISLHLLGSSCEWNEYISSHNNQLAGKYDSRALVDVSTRPGLIARNKNPSALYSAAYFATAIFSAAFDMAYGAWLERPDFNTSSVWPIPLLRVMTFLVVPRRRRGRKALMVCTTPTTLVLNCTESVSLFVYDRLAA